MKFFYFLSCLFLFSFSAFAQPIKLKGGWKNRVVANFAPVPNAGPDRNIQLPVNSLTLNGSATDDGGIASYQWIKTAGGAATLSGATTANLALTNLAAGSYIFTLTVVDDKGVSASDDVIVNVNPAANVPPVANAGSDQTVTLPTNSATVTGTGSDGDGTIASYLWEQTAGPSNATINTPNSAATIVSNLLEGTYTFSIKVTDNAGGTSTDNVQVIVLPAPANVLPIANAGVDKNTTLPINQVDLAGGGTDSDGTITGYSWAQINGPSVAVFSTPLNGNTTVYDLIPGVYEMELTVTDNSGGVSTDVMTITVYDAPNQAPSVEAGLTNTVTLPQDSIIVTAVADDVDGLIADYTWVKLTGPSGGTIVSDDSATTVIRTLQEGTYTFQVTVTDDDGATASDVVTIIVNAAPQANKAPVANAGSNKVITLPTNAATVNGSGSDDDGTVDAYAWTQVSGPNTATIQSPALATTQVSNLIEGTYVFRLTVTDNQGATGTSTVQVIVQPAPNISPVANAGPNKDITLPTNSVTFNGSASDIDGTIVSYSWSKVSGPAGGTIASPSSATTAINSLQEGTYLYELTVADNDGALHTDQVQIIVRPAIPPNVNPIANAGANQTITLPTNTATLTGSATDADGTIVSYAWAKISGPTGGTISSPSASTTNITSLVQGVYKYKLTVADNNGGTGVDTVQITVNGAANVPPTVNAGSDQTITLPVNSVTVTATPIDTDGTITNITWSRQAGPGTFTIVSPNSASTTINNLIQGVYDFQVSVTDNSGAVGTDVVRITVNAAVGQVANGNFPVSMATDARVSVIVTRYNDSAVVKTLVSDTFLTAGNHVLNWNGTDDFGVRLQAPDARYIVKVGKHNLKYDWMFTVGNYSDSLTGHTKHRGYYRAFQGLVFWGAYGYYCTGYSEGSPSLAKFLISKPGQKIDIFGPQVNPLDVNYVCTDGTNVYWAFFDPNAGNHTGVFATRNLDDAEVTFPISVTYDGVQSGRFFKSVIGKMDMANSLPTGMDVQKAGQNLYIARAGINNIQVLDKTTGAVKQSLTYPSPRWLHTDGSSIWMLTGTNTIAKYPANADGTIGAATLTIPAIEPHSVTVNPAGTVVSVTEGGTLQQVKHYNATTGALISTLGTLGGYYTSATVTDYKFCMTTIDGVGGGENKKQPFVAYQPDGSFWVNDPWSYRAIHYTSAGVYMEKQGWLGSTYTCAADPNNPSRLFWGFLEYKVDYLNKTWTLHKNWRARISYKTYNIKYDMKFVTLSNGRTYGLITKGATAEIIELSNTGDTTRPTGILRTGRLEPDGRIMQFTRGNLGGTSSMNVYALVQPIAGINPVWASTPTLLYRTPTITTLDPNAGPRTATSVLTASGRVIQFDAGAGATFTPQGTMITAKTNYKLGVLKQGVNTEWQWRTQLSTHRSYGGLYPDPAWSDAGNQVTDFAGGGFSTWGRYIVTNYHGENWKLAQTNYHHFYLDNGLSLGIYGTDRVVVGFGVHAAAKMAGNANTVQLIHEPISGNLYSINGDESDHSALGVWRISNLGSIIVENIVLDYPTSPIVKPANIMTGVPFNQVLPSSVAKWTRSHPEDSTNIYSNFYSVRTSYLKYKILETPDIYISNTSQAAQTKLVTADLGTNNITAGWSITGKVAYPNSMPNGQNQNQYLDVLDATGKVLIRFSVVINRSVIPALASIQMNGKILTSGTEGAIRRIANDLTNFEFKIVGGNVTVTYGTYFATGAIFDPTANWQTPKNLQVKNITTATLGGVYSSRIGLADITFRNYDTSPPTP